MINYSVEGWRCYILETKPVPEPRQSQRDRFNPSKAVIQYRLSKDEIRHEWRKAGVPFPVQYHWVLFYLPVYPSWSRSRQQQKLYTPHRGLADDSKAVDVDNLVKTLWDAVFPDDDSHLWDARITKLWVAPEQGAIEIRIPTTADHISLPFAENLSLIPPMDLS